jgi:hypothetical protein
MAIMASPPILFSYRLRRMKGSRRESFALEATPVLPTFNLHADMDSAVVIPTLILQKKLFAKLPSVGKFSQNPIVCTEKRIG